MNDAHSAQRGLSPWTGPRPPGLAVYGREASKSDDHGVVICVHGSLDRGGSFARVARRVDGPAVIAYDRRGYQGSRSLDASSEISTHVGDLLDVVAEISDGSHVTVLGHSFGGVVSLAAALSAPGSIDALVLYEPPMPWLATTPHPHRGVPLPDDPGAEVERFFRHMVSDSAWERLSDADRADRIADGPALVADMQVVRFGTPFSIEQLESLKVPLTIAVGTSTTMSHHVETAERVLAAVPDGRLSTIEGAGHGAHLTAPDRLADIVMAARHTADAP